MPPDLTFERVTSGGFVLRAAGVSGKVLVFSSAGCEYRTRTCFFTPDGQASFEQPENPPVTKRRHFELAWALAALAFLVAGPKQKLAAGADAPVQADWALRGGQVIDGTGRPGYRADVAIRGERIVAVGQFAVDPKAKLVDASRWVIAPGFIDLHTHSDSSILNAKTRSNLNYMRQGVTTVVTGNCGSGPVDAGAFLAKVDAQGAGTNIIHLIPHGSLRKAVMGNADRKASPDELAKMKELAERAMDGGAWGMSTGLIYLPGRYADTAELIELAKVVARHGGFYASHIRDEGEGLLASIDEALAIGKGAGVPVHISHLKASGKANWGLVNAACAKIEAARQAGQIVSADQYPYIASSTQLAAMVVPHWARQGNAAEFARIADDSEKGPKLREEIQKELDGHGVRSGANSIWIARYGPKPSRVGRDLAAIAEAEKTTPLEVVLDIERHGGAQAISFGMSEDDVRFVMRRPFVATASDGSAHAPGGEDRPHPRGYGTFPRKIRYALDEHVLSLEQAVRSCSGLPAEILGLPDRGIVRPGAIADLVVFDPTKFRDIARFDDPTRYAEGVAYLFVNGQAEIADGKYEGRLAGRALRLRKDGPADLLIQVGRIWTGDPARPWAEAIAVRNGQVVALGLREEIMHPRAGTTVLADWPRGFAMPGLIDAHAHLTELGAGLEQLDLRGVASLDEVARKIRERADATPGDGWIQGVHWDQSLWPGGAFPTAAVLDAVAPKRPVWLVRVDGHAGWANSEAMRRAGVTDATKPPPDGQIIRDKDGHATGVFIDGAKGLVTHAIPPPTDDELRKRILGAQELCLRAGLTGIHDASVSRREVALYRALDREGKLKLRVHGMASPPDGGEVAFVSHPPEPAKPGDRFTLRAIKLFMDGAMGSRGGLLFEPYADDPGNKGLMLIDPKVLEATTTAALRNGWQVCTHAIGDRGNDLVLTAYANALRAVPEAKDARLRVEHAQVVRKSDIARFKQWGIIASMQPSHASDDMRWADARLGTERSQGAYAWRWFVEGGVPLAFGSDFPVEVVNPFWGIYAGITRQDEKGQPTGGWHPDQKLSLEETLRAFTAGSAYAAFDEQRLGTLKPGMRADIIIVDRDLFDAKPLDVLKAKVTQSIIDGEVVYSRNRADANHAEGR